MEQIRNFRALTGRAQTAGGIEPIAIVGAGYVGLVTGACLAASGRKVTLIEIDATRRALIAQGEPPIYEPGLGALLARVTETGALRVSADLVAALENVR